MTREEYRAYARKHATTEWFNKGDRVTIDPNIQECRIGMVVTDAMVELAGKESTITTKANNRYRLKDFSYNWQDYMFLPPNDTDTGELIAMLEV